MQRKPFVLLLLEPPASPALQPHLLRYGLEVSTCRLNDLPETLSSSGPDVVVVGLPAMASRTQPTLLSVRLQLARLAVEPTLIAWAPWAERDDVPARPLVGAVVPLELPLAAAAHRISVLAKRTVQGKALDSRAPPRQRRVSSAPPPRLSQSTPADRTQTVRRVPVPGTPTPPESASYDQPPSPMAAPNASGWEYLSAASRSRGTVGVSKSPSAIRVPLTSPRESSSGVRVVLVDHDLTRADALMTTLRARRVQVHPTSPEVADLHLRLARRFSPHGIIVDEAVLRGRGAELVELMRGDPFLRHAQLVVVSLHRLFRAEVGATSLQTLHPLLEPLGKAEAALFDKLGPTCEVELGLDEIPAHLLLRLLSTRTIWTDLLCTTDEEALHWSVSTAGCGPAQLTRGERPAQMLAVEEAVIWLLEHPDARVVVTQRPEKDILRAEALTPVVDRLIQKWHLPHQPEQVVEAGSRARQQAPPARTAPLAWSDALPLSASPLASAADAEPRPSEAPVLPPAGQQSSTPPVALSDHSRVPALPASKKWLLAGLVFSLGAVGLLLAPRLRDTQPTAGAQGEWERQVSGAGAEPSPGESTSAETRPDSKREAPPEEQSGRQERALELAVEAPSEPALEPLRVPAEACQLSPCGDESSPLTPRRLVQLARSDLMEGRNADAQEKLCAAARDGADDVGSLALSRFYLERHCLSLAQTAADGLLRRRDGEADTLLLRADLASQQGQLDEGRRHLLAGIGVAPDDVAIQHAVSRKYLRDARTAMRHSSLALAERDLRRALLMWPEHGEAAGLLARVLERRGLREVAESWAQEVVKLDAGNGLALGVIERAETARHRDDRLR